MIKVKINGQEQSWDGDPDLPLLWFLRDEAGLTGTKFGCGQALCGACTVIVDKEAVRSCITSINDVAGREVTTIEGLHPTGDHPVQKAWRQVNVPQCGFCQAGQIMQAAALLMDNPKPSHEQIREAMSGNICRCGCYQRIENAVHLASTGCDHEFHRQSPEASWLRKAHQGREDLTPQHPEGPRSHRQLRACRTRDVTSGLRL